MLFPPPGVRIRRTIETFFLPDTPTLIAGRDPQRVFLVVVLDYTGSEIVTFAGSEKGLLTPVGQTGNFTPPLVFWGEEEVWAQYITGNTSGGGPILLQSVFYE